MNEFSEKILKTISDFFGSRTSHSLILDEFTPTSLPLWINEAAVFFKVEIGSHLTIILIKVDSDLDLDKIFTLYNVVRNFKFEKVLIWADNFTPKFRKDFVRSRIPHITSSGSVFAPELGVIYRETSLKTERVVERREKLFSLSQKLISKYLLSDSSPLDQHTLSEQVEYFSKESYETSISTLSRAYRQLESLEIVEFLGHGPHKKINFFEKDIVWSRLLELEVESVVKISEEFYRPDKNKFHWVYSSETALSRLGDLVPPKVEVIAMSMQDFRRWKNSGDRGEAYGDFGERSGLSIEIWRDNVTFLSKKESLNVIELALSLRRSRDPRVQIAVSELIEEIGLNANLLWEHR